MATSTAASEVAGARPLVPAPGSAPVTIDLNTASQLEEIEEEEERRLEEFATNPAAADNEVEADETTLWLRATEWPQQFAGRPLDVIAAFAKHPAPVAVAAGSYTLGSFQETVLVSPERDEERLRQISQLFALVFDHGIQTLQETLYQIRCWLKSYNPDKFFKDLEARHAKL